MNDNTQSISGSGETHAGGSSSDEKSTSENNFFIQNQDKNLGAESHFVVMQQDKGERIGLYLIVSDETDLDTGILPQTIRLVHTFESTGEAMSWLSDYDDRSN